MLTRYFPATSWADLDGRLGQADPQTIFPSEIYSSRATDPYVMAKELGIELPPMPAGGDAEQQIGWYTLCYMDIIDAQLRRAYGALLRTYQKTGVFMCRHLLQYNNTAYRLIRAQQEALIVLRKNGWTMFPATPPQPPLFTDLESCTNMDTLVRAKSAANPGGVGLSWGCGATTPAGLNDAGASAIAIAAIYAVAGLTAVWLYAREFARVNPEIAREITQQAAVESEWQMKRDELVEKKTDKCIANGGDPIECMEVADDTTPTDLQSLNAEWLDKLKGGKGWIWWAGAAAIGVVAIGGAVWFLRRRRQNTIIVSAPPRRLPRGEAIDADYEE